MSDYRCQLRRSIAKKCDTALHVALRGDAHHYRGIAKRG
jgi:hypothetical protein